MTMTSRERWLAAARLQSVDRLPFWPKLGASYPPAQVRPFRDMTCEAIHEWIGSDEHVGVGMGVKEVRKHTSLATERQNGTTVTLYKTPHGDLRTVSLWNEGSKSWHPTEFPVKRREDIAVMREFFEDLTWELDTEQIEAARARVREIGEHAVTTNWMVTSAMMQWVEWLAGVENAHYMLLDCPEEVESLFEVIHSRNARKVEIVCENSPADFLYLGENTSTTLISPDQYRTYCFPHIRGYAEIAKAHDRLMVLHMCGYLKDLLPDLAELPVAAFEAFTSPPVGNTTFVDGRAACPDTCLIGGTNATLWTYSAERIIAELDEHLSALPHHRGLVVTSAGVMPPLSTPETIKAVADWVRAYDARF